MTGVEKAWRWWVTPFATSTMWAGAAYSLTGLVFTTVVGLLGLSLVSLGLLLVVVGVGIVALPHMFDLANRMAEIERYRSVWVGDPIPPPALARPEGIQAWFTVSISDPKRWRLAAYFLAGPPVIIILTSLWVCPLAAVVTGLTFPTWSWAVGVHPIIGLLVGFVSFAALSGVARIVPVTTRLIYQMTFGLLGEPRTSSLQQQVEELTADREAILSAVATERRRIERNLHDGVQQYLVAAGVDLGLARDMFDQDPEQTQLLLRDAHGKVQQSIKDLRAIGRGLHPAILDDRGLASAVQSLASDGPIKINVVCDLDRRYGPGIEEVAYFVCAETTTNVIKHSKATEATVVLSSAEEALSITVLDNGVGGVTATSTGVGLSSISARISAVDGKCRIDSPAGGPTVVEITIPYTTTANKP